MSNVLAEIRDIKEMLNKLVTLVDTHVPPRRHQSSGKSHKRRQSNWTVIRSIIDELATSIQLVQQNVERLAINPNHCRIMGAGTRNATSEAPPPTSDRPPDERQQLNQNSLGPSEGAQNGQAVFVNPSSKADTQTIPTPQRSESDMDENSVRSTIVLDQLSHAPITVPIGAEGPELGENAVVGVAMPRRSRRLVASTNSQPDKPTQGVSGVAQAPNITIPYREENGVVVLMPLGMDQCCDTPYLLSQAEALGARETGVFKYVLPDDFEFSAQAISSVTTRVSRFTSRLGPDDIHRISRTEDLGTLDICNTSFTATEPDELAEILERRLDDPEAMSKMRYCTDVPAWTAEDRRRLGLPVESPIWPLKDNLLDRTKYSVDGLHRPYAYLADEGGSLFTIHVEDANLMSFNALYSGRDRPWYAVAPKDGCLIENEVKGGKCAQKVRHGSRWIPRSKLKAMGASFVTFAQRAGEVVVVLRGTYHQGGTVGPAIAEAVNYGGPSWSIEGYSECGRACPGFTIPNALLEFRAPNEPQREQDDEVSPEAQNSTQSGARRRAARHASQQIGEAVSTDLLTKRRSLQKRRGSPSSTLTSRPKRIRTIQSSGTTIMAENNVWIAPISQMAKAICSRAAIKQFFEIVRGRRDLEPTALRMSPSKYLSRSHDPTQILKNDIQIINIFSRKTVFNEFLIRLYQARLARYSGEVKESRERIRKGDVPKILKDTGMEKRQYYHHRDKGVKWREYCKMFPGILGFILFQTQPFGFSSTDWVHLKDTDFDSLRRCLNTKDISALCFAGKKFEHSLDLTADDVEFVGESMSLDEVSEGDLISCLRPVRTTEEIIYHKNAYPDWPRPEYWPDDLDWPADPTSLPPGEIQCTECDQSECNCASRRPEIQPRIRIYEGKGRGLQAVAREAGHIAYPKGVRLGWLTGELAPPNTHRNGRCYAMFRHDLPFEPEVAQINCGKISNIFGLMNHDCEPTASLVGKRVSGKYRVEVNARKDIRDGEEITIDYGPEFWEKGRCPCPKCSHVP